MKRPGKRRESLPGVQRRDDETDAPCDLLKLVPESSSLHAYLVGKIGVHVHAVGLRSDDHERHDVCLLVQGFALGDRELNENLIPAGRL